MVLGWILKPGKPGSHMQPPTAASRQLAISQSHSFICLEHQGAFCLQVTEYMGLPWWFLPRQETAIGPPDPEGPLEKEMATHSSILAWEIPWTEEPGGLQSMRSQKSQTQFSD